MADAKHTPGLRRLILDASTHQVAAINCLEMARAERRRHVGFWLLDAAASNRRHYAAARAAIAAATGGNHG